MSFVFARILPVSSPGPCARTSPSCCASWSLARTVASPRITLDTSVRSITLGSRLASHSSPRIASIACDSSSAARAARRQRRRMRKNSLGNRRGAEERRNSLRLVGVVGEGGRIGAVG
eukprot:scaffold840_cov344-Pavlova_lutheri.AAC.13